jgi:hypothetical protein
MRDSRALFFTGLFQPANKKAAVREAFLWFDCWVFKLGVKSIAVYKRLSNLKSLIVGLLGQNRIFVENATRKARPHFPVRRRACAQSATLRPPRHKHWDALPAQARSP